MKSSLDEIVSWHYVAWYHFQVLHYRIRIHPEILMEQFVAIQLIRNRKMFCKMGQKTWWQWSPEHWTRSFRVWRLLLSRISSTRFNFSSSSSSSSYLSSTISGLTSGNFAVVTSVVVIVVVVVDGVVVVLKVVAGILISLGRTGMGVRLGIANIVWARQTFKGDFISMAISEILQMRDYIVT